MGNHPATIGARIVDVMIAVGQDVISAVNAFSNLIARTMRESSPTMADDNGLGIPRSTQKQQALPRKCNVLTRSAAKATRRSLCASPHWQSPGTKRKDHHISDQGTSQCFGHTLGFEFN